MAIQTNLAAMNANAQKVDNKVLTNETEHNIRPAQNVANVTTSTLLNYSNQAHGG